MKYRSLVFDFDGTIADTLDEGLKIYNHLAGQHGLKKVDDHEIHILRNMKLNDFLDHLGVSRMLVPKLLYRGTQMLKSRIERLPLIEGIKDVLPFLRQNAENFGILTSNSVDNVKLFLQHHQLENTFDIISSTSKLTGKAKHLQSIRRRFSTQPEEMIYIGDEIRDIKAAKKAGVPIAAVSWGFNSADALLDAGPDYLMNHPAELTNLVH
ncbi:MAG: HAD-IA family hydrolase [Verrucomicrobiae bacterium]|nr:HAD-IA family hydrolase [Verrucomicrobiae bacterium]NNJ85644.1 HAD-IA family hydrolase [Akkermansiaceae bacterium]